MEWGCGGGANAVVFAAEAEKIIAADVSQSSVDECIAQVRAASDTPVEGVHIDLRDPATAVAGLAESCDTFLCMYVIELTAGPDEAAEILRIAKRVLVSGGMGFIQIRYHTADLATRGRRRRNYGRHLAHTTTFGIDEFWLKIQECGLTPRLLTLVPENRLDVRYAYYALTKP
jgi:cyclopropane fatty-acyl-phospholipid synthase-like methyltransferase